MKRKINALSRATKKMVSILLVVFTLTMLTGCADSTNSDSASTSSEAKAPAITQNIDSSSVVNDESLEAKISEESSLTDNSKDASSSSESEEPVDSDDSSSSGAASADGLYTYTVYGDIEIRMGINIDDYIFVNDEGNKFIKLYKMAADYGWIGDDIYSDPNDTSSEALSSTSFTRSDGKLKTVISLDKHMEYMDTLYSHQLSFIYVKFWDADTGNYYYGEDNEDETRDDLILTVAKHYSLCEYKNIGNSWKFSKDDLIILAYLLWHGSTNPGENAFVAAQSFDKDYNKNVSKYTIRYELP